MLVIGKKGFRIAVLENVYRLRQGERMIDGDRDRAEDLRGAVDRLPLPTRVKPNGDAISQADPLAVQEGRQGFDIFSEFRVGHLPPPVALLPTESDTIGKQRKCLQETVSVGRTLRYQRIRHEIRSASNCRKNPVAW